MAPIGKAGATEGQPGADGQLSDKQAHPADVWPDPGQLATGGATATTSNWQRKFAQLGSNAPTAGALRARPEKNAGRCRFAPSGRGEPERGMFALVQAGVIHQSGPGMPIRGETGTNTSLFVEGFSTMRQPKPPGKAPSSMVTTPAMRRASGSDQVLISGRKEAGIDDRRPHAVSWSSPAVAMAEPPWRRRRRSQVIAIAAAFTAADLQRLPAFFAGANASPSPRGMRSAQGASLGESR